MKIKAVNKPKKNVKELLMKVQAEINQKTKILDLTNKFQSWLFWRKNKKEYQNIEKRIKRMYGLQLHANRD